MQGIKVEQYKVIYKDVVYNPLEIAPQFEGEKDGIGEVVKPKFIIMLYINEDGELRLIEDEAWMFKFVRR